MGGAPLRALVFACGLAISLVMALRGQVAQDQLDHLVRGWQLAFEGVWVPFGPPATGGGAQPGGLTALVTGLPLLVWPDHRAPALLQVVCHVLGYLLLDRLVRRALGPGERLLFALLYWLNPWRLFYSGFLWNPSFLFLAGAVHLGTAWRLRRRPRFWASFAHVLTLGAAIQLHSSALMLVLASALLWWRRHLRLSLAGALLAAATVALSLVPWALAVADDPGMLPAGEGLPLRGLVTVYPVVQGLLHWLRFPGLALGRAMIVIDLSWLGGPGVDLLDAPLRGVRLTLLLPTLVVSFWANQRLWRHQRRRWWRPIGPAASARSWLAAYARWCLLAALASFAMAPISVTHWYVFAVFHAALLPVVLAAGALRRTARARLVTAGLGLYAAIVLLLGPALALGSPPYRCGEPRGTAKAFATVTLRADHPMLEQLGIQKRCPIAVDDPEGWWPEGLPEGPPRR